MADPIARGYGIGILNPWLADCPRHGARGSVSRVLAERIGTPSERAGHVPQGPRSWRSRVLAGDLLAHLSRRGAFGAAC